MGPVDRRHRHLHREEQREEDGSHHRRGWSTGTLDLGLRSTPDTDPRRDRRRPEPPRAGRPEHLLLDSIQMLFQQGL